MSENHSNKSRLVCLLLCWFLGFLGIHRFYVGKTGTGILMILTGGGLCIWWLIDLIMVAIGSFTDSEGRVVFQWTEPGS
ncbi:MAG: TM2 domain-containing protein [Planctomycetota bacterium]|nr:TM2 domain-containing protein [Planctomycetota bacterium]